MIVKRFRVSNTLMSIPFEGDPLKQWFVEVLDANYKAPTIKGIANGMIHLEFVPECLNIEDMKLAFHTPDEKSLVEDTDGTPETRILTNIVMQINKRGPAALKYLVKAILIVIIAGFALSVFRILAPNLAGKFSKFWKDTSIVSVSEKIDEKFVENSDDNFMIMRNNHPLYDSEQLKEIEDEEKMSFRKMFRYTGNGLFLMVDLINIDGEPIPFEKSEAEDECDKIGARLPLLSEIERIKSIRVSEWGDFPEWTDTSSGFASDDYVLFMKNGAMPNGAYKQNSMIFADDGDVMAYARCAFKTSDFE